MLQSLRCYCYALVPKTYATADRAHPHYQNRIPDCLFQSHLVLLYPRAGNFCTDPISYCELIWVTPISRCSDLLLLFKPSV
uniref:Uncharacterized protein n=1 Tax=Arundo donax TaxID=35708 RepID=A0A0A8YYY1_ARUDO